jgi:uncharacterized membrane protein
MHRRHKHDIIVVLALVGFGVSTYLAAAHYLNAPVVCDITKGCEDVLKSKYSMLFGLPLAVWGMGFFTSVVISALLANHYAVWRKILSFVLGAGSVASLVFLSLQFFVIKKVCQYCLTTDLLTILLFIWDLNIEHRNNDKN